MTNKTFSAWINTLANITQQNGHRALVALLGDRAWAHSYISTALETLNVDQVIHYSDSVDAPSDCIDRKNYRQYLGQESQCIMFDGQQLNIDAFAALSGTLVAGGILFLYMSDESNDAPLDSHLFVKRFLHQLRHSQGYVVEEGKRLADLPKKSASSNTGSSIQRTELQYHCITDEQVSAVEQICKVAKGHRNRPLVLTADRGRGKSTALALACVELLSRSEQAMTIAITAPHQQALAVFFTQLKRHCPTIVQKGNSFMHENGNIEFIAVDELIANKTPVHVLFIDEAAGVPVYLLNDIAERYHRVVFSSTVHGYEGAGRSFTLKFQRHLELVCPQWQSFHMHQAIRWQANDPLEKFVFDTCLLNSELPDVSLEKSALTTIEEHLTFEHISQSQLLAEETLLAQVFAVLVTAHYQTSPSDVELLLNNNKVSVVVLMHKHVPVAVALLMREGQDNVDIDALKQSKMRARSHFIPQSLLTHCGFEQSFDYSYLRIMRIAVHPKFQHSGIGSHFLHCIELFAKQKRIDIIGTSYGASQSLLSFWQKNHYNLARIGLTKHKASGEHSALMIKVVNEDVRDFVSEIERVCYQYFIHLLADELSELDAKLVVNILQFLPATERPQLSAFEQQSVVHFARGQRQYGCCVLALHKWLVANINSPQSDNVLPLVAKTLQKKPIGVVCHQFGFTGKKALMQHMTRYISDQICS